MGATERTTALEHVYEVGRSTLVVRFGDLLESQAEVLVSSDDFLLSMGGGVSGAILEAGGHAVAIDAAKAVPRSLGDVVVTGAGALPARYVFHVVTIGPPASDDGRTHPEPDPLEFVRSATARCLDVMGPLDVRSIAFPALGAGVAGLDVDVVAHGMVETIHETLASDPWQRRVELHLRPKRWQNEFDYIPFFEELARRCGSTDIVVRSRRTEPIHMEPSADHVSRQRSQILRIDQERVSIEGRMRAADPSQADDLALEYVAKTQELAEAIRERSPTRLFVSYAHDDDDIAGLFIKHLAGLRMEGLATWSDRAIRPGSSWEDEVSEALEQADVALFLISASFLSSEYCVGKEWHRALERRAPAGQMRMIPVVLKPCDWQPLVGHLQSLPQDGKPLTSHDHLDQAMLDVVQRLRQLLSGSSEVHPA